MTSVLRGAAAAARTGVPSSRAPAGVRVAAMLALAAPAVAAWATLLGGFAIRALPLAVVVALAAAGRSRRPAATALIATIVAAPLLAGVPADDLRPGAWPEVPARLAGGARQLTALATAPVGHDPWPLAAGLVLAGVAWSASAALSVTGRRPLAAVLVGGMPWLAAIVLGQMDTAVWQGAAVVFAGLLSCSSTRIAVPAATSLGLCVALVAGVTAHGIAPRHALLTPPAPFARAGPRFHVLATEPTFGPLTDRRTGAPMLEIGAAAPALWRLQVLDVFDGYRWRVAEPGQELPQPAAEPVAIDVRVRGLRNDLIASPGRILSVKAGGSVHPAPGEAWRLASPPRPGSHYHVTAEVVRPTIQQLRAAPLPRDPRLLAYTRLGWPDGSGGLGRIALPLLMPLLGDIELHGLPLDVPLLGQPPDRQERAALDAMPYRRVGALARRLAAGATSEWQVVARVQSYLLDGDRFRYTTDVGAPGPLPLVDFLLRDRAGYCQQFAGAAALLLRLAGVPARMVAGFATGVQRGGRYVARDVDAHAWIEVYFEGYGWVPFNPTPAAAPAAVSGTLNPLAVSASSTGPGPVKLGGAIAALTAALAAVALAAALLRRDPPQLGDRLERLLESPGDGAAPPRTLRRLGEELGRRVGPHTSALAFEAERARFAPGPTATRRRVAFRVTGALVRDLGPWRAALLLARRGAVGRRAARPAGRLGLALGPVPWPWRRT